MYTVDINFESDLDEIFKNELLLNHYTVDPLLNSRDLRIKYFNFKKRIIGANSRQVYLSKEFICPSEHQVGFNMLKIKIERGEDLIPHHSKFLTDLDYNDSLLNDWGIHHLHLGEELEANGSGFIKRTGPVLFLFIDGKKALFINVLPHGNWTNQQMVKVIHDNWPESIEKYRLNIAGLTHVPTDNDIKILRGEGVNSAIQIESGIVYTPMGGGLTTAKTSMAVMQSVNYISRITKQLQKQLIDKAEEIGSQLEIKYNYKGNQLKFKLIIQSNGYYAVEQNTMERFHLRNF